MKLFSKLCVLAGLAAILAVFTDIPATADTYHTANFSGSVKSGGANVKDPFTTIMTQGDPVSGSFVFDDQLIPASTPPTGSNVFFSNFPDIGLIPSATVFNIHVGVPGKTFTFADALPGNPPGIIPSRAAIQYINGVFNGFFFVSDFLFTDGHPYRFDIEGKSWSIKLLDQLGGSPVPINSLRVSGSIDIIAGLTNVQPFTPAPLPPTMLLLGSSILAMVGWRRFRKN